MADISKIKLPDGAIYNLKDGEFRKIHFSLGSTVNKPTWTVLATTSSSNAAGNVSGTFLLSDAANIGGVRQGVWLIQISSRGSVPTMIVTELAKPTNTSIVFGYYEVPSQSIFKFGFYVPAYRGSCNITVLGTTGVTIGNILSTNSQPSGWTPVTIERYADKSKLDSLEQKINTTESTLIIKMRRGRLNSSVDTLH